MQTSMPYSKLYDLIAVGNWKQADVETAQVMLVVAKHFKYLC